MKKLDTTGKIAMSGMLIAFLFTIGYIVETTIPYGFLGTVIAPNPMEALIIIAVVLLGWIWAVGVAFGYFLLILLTKPTLSSYVGELALITAMLSYIGAYLLARRITRNANFDLFKKGVVRVAIAAVIMTIWMTFLNVIWFSPAFYEVYVNGGSNPFTFIWSLGRSWKDTFIYAAKPFPAGTGIIHGNIIKYGLAGFVCATLWRTPFMRDYTK